MSHKFKKILPELIVVIVGSLISFVHPGLSAVALLILVVLWLRE